MEVGATLKKARTDSGADRVQTVARPFGCQPNVKDCLWTAFSPGTRTQVSLENGHRESVLGEAGSEIRRGNTRQTCLYCGCELDQHRSFPKATVRLRYEKEMLEGSLCQRCNDRDKPPHSAWLLKLFKFGVKFGDDQEITDLICRFISRVYALFWKTSPGVSERCLLAWSPGQNAGSLARLWFDQSHYRTFEQNRRKGRIEPVGDEADDGLTTHLALEDDLWQL